MQIGRAGIVAVAVGYVWAAPPTTTISAAEDVGRSTMDVYPPSGSRFFWFIWENMLMDHFRSRGQPLSFPTRVCDWISWT
jgi:hypothetical protein